ncbi:hypothetical protein FAM23852_000544 [Propionibacterium freudenreichii]|uniref:hypothetical protein n=1 Tax=Propionibacterium freudenreichii TaxID=1744 RepID=UPI00254D4315|nr:hypothetical protein [Propionibacterium freudenreichii]MDK9321091.1 hypothetical protein [Propionibacterium freudenreichii]MDK9324948.1 hypothetical protein [Propionibacterium freudenreichii]
MKSRTVARVVRVALVALCAIIGVVLLVMGRHVLGAVVLVGGAGLLGMGTQVIGDPHDIHGLPAGVSAADIKAYLVGPIAEPPSPTRSARWAGTLPAAPTETAAPTDTTRAAATATTAGRRVPGNDRLAESPADR